LTEAAAEPIEAETVRVRSLQSAMKEQRRWQSWTQRRPTQNEAWLEEAKASSEAEPEADGVEREVTG
jgi:hypothetical protein